VVVAPELGEAASHDLYYEHIHDCLACDPGAGRVCSMGVKLHRRWRRAALLQSAAEASS
jgi:hypothetical protein